jgi:DNA-damage-inducible protein J
MAQVNIRIDDTLKEQGEKLFAMLGMNFSTAVNVFISQAVREGGLPFAITTKTDPFYSESNRKALRQSIREAEEGKLVTKTIDELLAMEK